MSKYVCHRCGKVNLMTEGYHTDYEGYFYCTDCPENGKSLKRRDA